MLPFSPAPDLASPLSVPFNENIQERASRRADAPRSPIILIIGSERNEVRQLRNPGFVPLYLRQPNDRLTQLTNSRHPNLDRDTTG